MHFLSNFFLTFLLSFSACLSVDSFNSTVASNGKDGFSNLEGLLVGIRKTTTPSPVLRAAPSLSTEFSELVKKSKVNFELLKNPTRKVHRNKDFTSDLPFLREKSNTSFRDDIHISGGTDDDFAHFEGSGGREDVIFEIPEEDALENTKDDKKVKQFIGKPDKKNLKKKEKVKTILFNSSPSKDYHDKKISNHRNKTDTKNSLKKSLNSDNVDNYTKRTLQFPSSTSTAHVILPSVPRRDNPSENYQTNILNSSTFHLHPVTLSTLERLTSQTVSNSTQTELIQDERELLSEAKPKSDVEIMDLSSANDGGRLNDDWSSSGFDEPDADDLDGKISNKENDQYDLENKKVKSNLQNNEMKFKENSSDNTKKVPVVAIKTEGQEKNDATGRTTYIVVGVCLGSAFMCTVAIIMACRKKSKKPELKPNGFSRMDDIYMNELKKWSGNSSTNLNENDSRMAASTF